MRKLIISCLAALTGLALRAATPAQLLTAIGNPANVTVLGASTWDVGSDSGIWPTAAKSTNKGQNSSESSLIFQVTGTGSLAFNYRVSSEGSYDYLIVLVDDVEQNKFSGYDSVVQAQSCVVPIATGGTHVITLKYKKDGSGNKGEDTVWVTGVTWGLESVLTVPASVTKITSSMYAGDKSMSKIVFEAGSQLTEVANGAFANCTSLKSIVFPEGLTTIGDNVFDGCTLLTDIQLPSTLVSLGRVNVSKMPAMADTFGDGYWLLNDWVIGYHGDCPAEIPEADRVRGFAKGALKNCQSIRSFAPGTRNLTGISDEAFFHCFNLEYVELPSSLGAIGQYAFEGCTQLAEIAIPGSVKTVGDYAFRYCYGLQYLAIASGVESIGRDAFYDDYLLMEVDLPATVGTIGYDAFGGDSSIIRVGVRGDINTLAYFFSNYQYIREVTVKDGTGSLKDGLFRDCLALEDVRFLSSEAPSLDNKGTALFENTPGTLTVYVPSGSVGWVNIPGAPGLPQAWPREAATRRAIAYWNVPTYLVEFDSNGGSLGVQPTYQKPETNFRLPPQPTQSGYTFAGWWTSPVEGWQVTDETVFLEGVYQKLYAHWIRPHKIFLNANGGTVTNSTVTYVEQTVYGVLPAPVRTGYAFAGWTYGDETIVPHKQFVVDADHTLTAQWNAYRYSVHFLPNGGSGSAIAQEFKYDTVQSLEKCRFTRPGYTCVGWATSAAGAVVYQDGQVVKNLSALQGGIVNLYAVWARNYTVTFNRCDGTGVKASYAFPYGYAARLPAIKNGLHWERTGWKFKGWATSEANAKAGTVWKPDWANVSTAAAAGATLNVYAVWEVVSPYYAIRYNKCDGSGTFRTQAYRYGDTSHLATIRYGLGWARKGFVFKGWSTSAANANAGTVWKADWGTISTGVPAGTTFDVYASWTVDASAYYAIKFMKNDGGAGWRTVGFEHGVDTHLPTCQNGLGWTRAGYTFKGWATSAANAAAGKIWKADYAIVGTPVAKGQTLTVYAVWQANAAGQVVAPPPAAVRASVAAAPQTLEILTGVLADGSAEFTLYLDADCAGCLQLEAANGDSRALLCAVTDLDGLLLAVTEEGETLCLLAE